MIRSNGVEGERVAGKASLYRVAQQVYEIYRAVTDEAVQELLARVHASEQLDQLLAWAAHELLNKMRLSANQPIYAQAHGLRARLQVETPPSGYKLPTESAVNMPTAVHSTGHRDNMVLIQPGQIASWRTLLRVKIRLDRKTVQPRDMTKSEVVRAATQLREQGDGCYRNAALLSEFASQMRDTERGIDTIRRLERGVD